MNYNQILDIINQNIKRNEREEITGPVLNSVLRILLDFTNEGLINIRDVIQILADSDANVLGSINPSTNTETLPDGVYHAQIAGKYDNAGGIVVKEGYYTLLRKKDSQWSLEAEVEMPNISINGKIEVGQTTEGINGDTAIKYIQNKAIVPYDSAFASSVGYANRAIVYASNGKTYQSNKDNNKDALTSASWTEIILNIPTGEVKEEEKRAVSGGDVFKYVNSKILTSNVSMQWKNGYISRTGTYNSSSIFSYCEIDVSKLNINKRILVSAIVDSNSSVRLLVFVNEQNNVLLAVDQNIDTYYDYIPSGASKIYVNSNRMTTESAFFLQKKDVADILFSDQKDLNLLSKDVKNIRNIFSPSLLVGYVSRDGALINNVSWRHFIIQASELDLSNMIYFRTFDTTTSARGIIFYDEENNRINVSSEYQNEFYSYVPPKTHHIVCNVPASRVNDFIFTQNKIENYLAKKYSNSQKNGIYSWWIYPLAKRVYTNENDYTFFGYVANTGEVTVGKRDNNTLEITNTILRKYQSDDHNACSVEIADDGSVIVAHASGHSGGNVMHLYKSMRPYDISEFNYKPIECDGMTTYSQLVKLSDKTAWFYRHNNGGLHVRIITDNYTNVSAEIQLSIGREYALFRKNPENDWILCTGTPHPSNKQTVIAFYIDIDNMIYRNINGVDIGDIANGLNVSNAMLIADDSVNSRLLDLRPISTSSFEVLICRFTKFSAPFDGIIYSYKVDDNLISEIKEIAPQGHPMYIGSNYIGGGSYMQDDSVLIANNNGIDKWQLLKIKDNNLVVIDSVTGDIENSIGRPYESLDGQIIYHKGFYKSSSYEIHSTTLNFK